MFKILKIISTNYWIGWENTKRHLRTKICPYIEQRYQIFAFDAFDLLLPLIAHIQMMNFVGVEPVRNTYGKLIAYRYKPLTIWQKGMLLCLGLFFLDDLRRDLDSRDFHLQMECVYLVMKTYRYFYLIGCMIFCSIHADKLVELFPKINNVFAMFDQLRVDYGFTFMFVAAWCAPLVIYEYIGFNICMLELYSNERHQTIVCTFLYMMYRFSMMMPWHLLCCFQAYMTIYLNRFLREWVEIREKREDPNLEYYREDMFIVHTLLKIHQRQYEITQVFNMWLGTPVFFVFLAQYTEYLYFAFQVVDDLKFGNMFWFFDVVGLVLFLIIPGLVAMAKITEMQLILQKLPLGPNDESLKTLITLHGLQQKNIPIKYTVAGYPLTFDIVQNIFSTVLTIFVAMIGM